MGLGGSRWICRRRTRRQLDFIKGLWTTMKTEAAACPGLKCRYLPWYGEKYESTKVDRRVPLVGRILEDAYRRTEKLDSGKSMDIAFPPGKL
jgi:hypothetical protein